MKLNKYIAYTNSTHTKDSAVALAMAHEEADRYVKGSYKTCSIGCMTGGENHHLMGELFGFDPRIGHVMDRVFEGLPNGEHKTFTAKVFKAMLKGLDTTKVYANFMAKVLRRAAKHDKTGNCDAVANLHDLLVDGIFVEKDWVAAWAAGDAAGDAWSAEHQQQAQDLIDSCEYFGGLNK